MTLSMLTACGANIKNNQQFIPCSEHQIVYNREGDVITDETKMEILANNLVHEELCQ